MATLSVSLRGKLRLMEVIMRNAADQLRWAPILDQVARQLQVIGDKLGPEGIKPDGLAFEYEKLGDLFGQFIDQHRVEFAYEKVQKKFEVWKGDIDATFEAFSKDLEEQQKAFTDPNFEDLSKVHERLVDSMKKALASPVKLMNLQQNKKIQTIYLY